MIKPPNEAARLRSLRALGALEGTLEKQYDDLTELAATLCAAPIAAISFVSDDHVWFKAHRGPIENRLNREASICARTILNERPNQISDLTRDPEYANASFVHGAPAYRAYLGVPLVTSDGYALGALCVFDVVTRTFSAEQVRALELLARQVMRQLEARRPLPAGREQEERLGQERALFRELVEDLHEVVFRADAQGKWSYLNPAWREHLGLDPWASIGQPIEASLAARDIARFKEAVEALKLGGKPATQLKLSFLTAGGGEKPFSMSLKVHPGANGESLLSGTLADLTTESVASQRERDIESFFVSSPFIMGVAELRGPEILFVSVNPACQRLLKAEQFEFPALSSTIGMNEAVTAWWHQKYHDCDDAGGTLAFTATFHEGAEQRWLRVYLSRVKAEQGKPARYSFITADITEEKILSDVMERQRRLLETVSEHVGDVIWMADLTQQGDISFVSRAYERIWGQSRESLLANRDTFLQPIHPEDRARVIAAMPNQIKGIYEETYRVNSPAGERWVRDRAFPVKNEQGEVVQLVGVASDITEVRNQEEGIRRAKENLEEVIGHLPVAVCVYASDGTREYVNENWTKLFGWTLAEVVGTPVPPAMFPDAEAMRVALEFLKTPGQTRELGVRNKEGVTKPCLISIIALPLGKSMTIIRDLTQERAQAQIIEEQRQVMVESARLSSLGEMAAGVAHEINNPLAIIQGSAELVVSALERGTIEPEKLARAMERISMTVNRIAKIIVGLKSFARDGRKDPLLPASVKGIVGEALELCQTRFRNNGVELHLDLPERDVIVEARSVQLAQLLVNLLNNAFDAVADRPTKNVCISVRAEFGRAKIRVLDDGPGVPDDLKEKIMQPFFTTKAPGKGTGLGLSLSRSIVEDHGGKLIVSTVGKMTCFEADFPAAG